MADFYDISSWQEQEYYNTGGTRNKAIFQNPNDESFYFFKTSLRKRDKDYKYEFWSEIIASEVGLHLKFNALKYDIAYNGIELGCISKLMINNSESLVEGYKYLTAYNPNYTYEDKKGYTFQLIRDALKKHTAESAITDIIKIIIFDSIIGNSDRHQENWGFIQKLTTSYSKNKIKKSEFTINILIELNFSPIYDSGSCLGREIADAKICQLLSNEEMMRAYINRGKSEIRWHGDKLNHFELIAKVKEEYNEAVKEIIQTAKDRFSLKAISNIVMNIDNNLPNNLKEYKIPEERKNLIIKLITLRYERLISIL